MDKAQPRGVSSALLTNTKLYVPRVEFCEFTLDNGLRVIMSKNERIPSVAVNTAYHAGAKDEEEGKSGLAHLFEHLLFEGTANTRNGEFDVLLQQRGGDSNAYTTMDITSYYMVVPSNQLEFALWLDSDRMAGIGIDGKSLEIQKDVVLEEKMTVYDNSPYGSLEEESSGRLFAGSKYSKMIIGSAEDVQGLSLDDIRDFWEKFYVPSNAVLSIAGDIDYSRTEDLVRKYYGEFPYKHKPPKPPFTGRERTGEIRDVIYDDVSLPAVFIFYPLPPMGSDENYAMKAVSAIMSDGESSRLYKKLVYEKELVSEIDSAVYEMEDVSMLSITAYGNEGTDTGLIEREIYGVISSLGDGEFTAEELIKVKNKIETSFSARRYSIINLSDKLSYLKTFRGDAGLINTEINHYLGLTRDNLADAVRKYLDSRQRVVLTYLPR